MDTYVLTYARLRGSPGLPPIGVRYRCSQLSRDAMRWVHMHNMFLSVTDFWRYSDKAYNSVPGSGGPNPLHAIPCVHVFTLMPLCHSFYHIGARRRRSGDGPGGGCARRPVGIPSPPRSGRWKPRSRAGPGTVGG
jgi:hypothetical protein